MSFNISEVADYLGIEKLQDTGGDSIPICCPYCGDRRGKNTICIRKDGKEKNVFQCFSCGRHGNMLDLYLDQKAGYVGVDRYKRAYADLRDALGKGYRDHTPKKRMEETDRKDQSSGERVRPYLPELAASSDVADDRPIGPAAPDAY